MVPYATIWYEMLPYGTIWYLMVPYGTICGSAETVGGYLYAAYTQPIRSYTPDLYAQSIRQIHLYAAYTLSLIHI